MPNHRCAPLSTEIALQLTENGIFFCYAALRDDAIYRPRERYPTLEYEIGR